MGEMAISEDSKISNTKRIEKTRKTQRMTDIEVHEDE